jgi:hypothetical protein
MLARAIQEVLLSNVHIYIMLVLKPPKFQQVGSVAFGVPLV